MRGILWRLLLMVAVAGMSGRAESPDAGLGYQVKAMFLYNFAKFVEWPPEKLVGGKPIVIAVYGQDPFGASLDQILQGKTVNGRALVIRRLSELTDLQECHVLFISSSEKKHLAPILQKAENGGVLTIAELKGFAEQGGMVNLTTRGDTVGLEVNAGAVERAHIIISYKLMRLAKIVQRQSPGGRN